MVRRAARIAAACLLVIAAQSVHAGDGPSLDPTRPCPGDCDGNGEVTVDELTTGVAIALGGASADACRDAYCSGGCGPGPGLPPLKVACLIKAVRSALAGCNTAPCEVDADCDDANGCSLDRCRSGVCTNDCACV